MNTRIDTVSTLIEERMLHPFTVPAARNTLRARIKKHIDEDSPIRMVLPSFPFKSPNRKDKVLGKLPDTAEKVTLGCLDKWCSDITAHHEPGCELTIVSDGRIFQDILNVPLEDVLAFKHRVRTLLPLKHIRWNDLEDFTAVNVNRLDDAAPVKREDILEDIATRTDIALLANSIKTFMREETRDNVRGWCKEDRHRWLDDLVVEMLRRNRIFASLVRDHFRDHIRLSVHADPSHTEKLGIRLLNTVDRGRTPWHNVAVHLPDDTWTLIHKKAAIKHGFTLVHDENGRPLHFSA